MPANDTPNTIGPYTLGRQLGKGGMAVVYEAVDRRNNQKIALKLLPADAHSNKELRARFLREGKNAISLQHPNIVDILDAGQADGQYYIAMELLTGGTLHEYLSNQDEPLSLIDCIGALRKIAAGLDYAHSQGILHRDVKPANIMLSADRTPKLVDFGIAKQTGSEQSLLTHTGQTLGTPAFMSPEQTLNSTDIDKQSDIYSLGVVAFSMMTGELPFHDSSHVVLLYKIAHESVPDARVFRSDLPKGVAQALNKVLNKNPEKRHRSATAFVNDLEGGARRRPAKGASSLSAVFSRGGFSRGGFSRSGISRGGNRAEKETPRQKSRGQGEPNQVSSEQAEPSPASRRAASRKAAQRTPVPNTPALQSHRRRRRRDNLLVASAGVGIVLLTGFLLFSFSSRSSQDDLSQAAVIGEEAAGLNAVQSSPSVPSENDESVSQNEVGFEEDRSDSEAAGETIDEADAESGGENDGEADNQARRAAQRNNQSGAPPIEEPPIEEPTEEAIATATSLETSTLVPQGTAASRAATSTPFPTSTLIPTRTPQPTSTQPTSTQPSAASRSATRPSTQRAIPQRAITLLEPGNDITLRGSQTFRWSSTVTLEEGEGFELVFWQLGQDPFTEGRSPIGAGTESTVRFNVERAATTLGLRHQEIYAWGVRLVRLDPFEPLAYLGGGNRFKVDLGGNDGGGNDGRNNSERSGDTSGQSDGSGGDSDSGRGSAYPGPGD